MSVGGSSSVGQKTGLSSKKGIFFEAEKWCNEEDFQNLLKTSLSFRGALNGFNEEKMGKQQKEEFV